MKRATLLVVALGLLTASPLQGQVDPDSIQAWTAALESGTLAEKVSAASRLASSDPSSLPSTTVDAAVAALEELEAFPDPVPGIEELGDEDLAGYHVDLVIIVAAAGDGSTDLVLVPSVSVSIGVQRRVAQLGDAAVPELVDMVEEERDAASALQTLALVWFWSDSVSAPLSPASRAAILGAFIEVTDAGSFRARLGAALGLGYTADPALLVLARDFRERMSVEEPWVTGFLDLDAIAPLEDRYEAATLSELTLLTARLAAAVCYGSTGDLATTCATVTTGLDDAGQALAAGDSASAAQAFEEVRSAAEAAFGAGVLTVSQRALLAGNAEAFVEEAGGLGAPEWAAGTFYAVGDEASYGGFDYRARQAHTAQVGWEPPNVYALWERINAGDEWAPQVIYQTDDEVTYQGTTYRAIQGHQSQPGWEPPNVPALWQAVN